MINGIENDIVQYLSAMFNLKMEVHSQLREHWYLKRPNSSLKVHIV